ncbi:MAG: hypothetical protein ACUVQ1_02955 [Candidatus Kapaibacteriales bacterium]
MSQMLKFNDKIVDQVITHLETLTNSISKLLRDGGNFSFIRDQLDYLLSEREKYVELFEQFYSDEDLKKLFSKNHNQWSSRVSRLIEQDNSNIQVIESVLKKLTEEIKNFNRQKSLMIYSKGQ